MKRFISLLAVALLSTVFAAGCGKLKECKDSTDAKECADKTKFEGEKACKWVAEEKDGDKVKTAAHCAPDEAAPAKKDDKTKTE